jgi:hypothetical protein
MWVLGVHGQDGQSTQAGVCRFIGQGGKHERKSFYQRLAKASTQELPSVETNADVHVQLTDGVYHQCSNCSML